MRTSEIAAFCLLAAVSAAASRRPDIRTIIQRSVEANQRDWDAAPQYDYTERSRDKSGGTRTYEAVMLDGTPYDRPIADNGVPLSPGQESQEQQKQDQELARRRAESPQARAARIARYKADRQRDHLLMGQLAAGMRFTFLREQSVGPYRCYVLRATPRPGYQPPNTESKVLKGMRGRLWIDEDSFQWVKVEATVIRPVYMEGFLARVDPGTHFELEKLPVGGGLWYMSHFAMSARARVLFMFPYRSAEEDWYSGYRKAAPLSSSYLLKPR